MNITELFASKGESETLSLHYPLLESEAASNPGNLKVEPNESEMDIDDRTGSPPPPPSTTLSRDSQLQLLHPLPSLKVENAAPDCSINDEELYQPGREKVTDENPLGFENMDAVVPSSAHFEFGHNKTLEDNPSQQRGFLTTTTSSTPMLFPDTPKLPKGIGGIYPNRTFLSLLDACQQQNDEAMPVELPVSSEMDVSLLVELNQSSRRSDQKIIQKEDQVVPNFPFTTTGRGKRKRRDSTENGFEVRRSNRLKRNCLENLRNPVAATATLTLQTQQRKKDADEMNSIIEPVVINRSRTIVDPVSVSPKPKKLCNHSDLIEPVTSTAQAQSQAPSSAPPTPTYATNEDEEKAKLAALKIILKKIPPINPLGFRINKQSYNKGLIKAGKHASADLYLSGTMKPKVAYRNSLNKDNSYFPKLLRLDEIHFGGIDVQKVIESMKMEKMIEHNNVAYNRAHGKKGLEGAATLKFSRDMEAIKGTFPKIDLDDNKYDELLAAQESILKDFNLDEIVPSTASVSTNMNCTLANLFNESQIQDEMDEEKEIPKIKRKRRILHHDIVGAVPVEKTDFQSPKNREFFSTRTVFNLEGQIYRLNPAVIVVQRTPDELIANIKSAPQRVTFQSTYYGTLTSYFDGK